MEKFKSLESLLKGMKCSKCSKKALADLKHQGPLCKECFSRAVERRIRKYVRLNKLFSKGDNIVVKGGLSRFLIEKIIKDLPVSIKRSGKGKVVEDRTMDDEIYSFFGAVFAGRKVEWPKNISFLRVVTDEEAELFAKFNNVEFKPKRKLRKVKDFIEPISEKHIETKFAVLKSVDQLRGMEVE